MELIPDSVQIEQYWNERLANEEAARIKPAAHFEDAVIDRLHGATTSATWTPIGWQKADGNFDLRPGELTLWTGVNGHGKTTFLSQAMLNVMGAGQKVCLASLEMPPATTMLKMTRQAIGVETPTIRYIKAFHSWTNDKLWIYDRQGKVPAQKMLELAAFVREKLGIDHLVIDSLMKCGLGTDDYTAQKDFVDGLQTLALQTGLHVHLVCHMRKGEREDKAPDKFDVKGAGEITDITDNLVIVWKNMRKLGKPADQRAPDEPDAFVRVAKQRHHRWEGSMAFWFDITNEQFHEFPNQRATCIDVQAQLPQ